jgi:hypothetical protein
MAGRNHQGKPQWTTCWRPASTASSARNIPSGAAGYNKETMMKHVLFATIAMLGLASAIPAFADGGGEGVPIESANSLPPGFYDHTDRQIQDQIKQNYFAARQAEQAKLVAKSVSAGVSG